MKKFIGLSLFVLLSTSAFAQDGDLVLQGEKWVAKFKHYVCSENGVGVEAPAAFKKLNVVFEKITTDSTLDNGLIKATFTENGVDCRYSAIVLANNDLKTIKLVESKAYAPANAEASCSEGLAVLDEAFRDNKYLYFGHPHNLAVMAPVEGAEEVCQGSAHVGITFVVSGRVK